MIQNIQYKGIKWINIVNPESKDIDHLRNNYPFHPLDLEDCLSRVQRPKIDAYADYVFMILHFPLYAKENKRLVTTEIDFFVGKDYLVTIHDGNLKPLKELFASCVNSKQETKKCLGEDAPHLLYNIVDIMVDYCFPITKKIYEELNIIDREVFSQDMKHIVEDISRVRRNIVFFQTIVKPQIPLFNSLEQGEVKLLNAELTDYWGNILDHVKKVWDYLEDYRELLNGLSDTVESLLTHRTNEIIKVLTLFSVIMLPLSLVAGIYGMNIAGLPFANHPLSLILVSLLMGGIVLAMVVYFKIRRWF